MSSGFRRAEDALLRLLLRYLKRGDDDLAVQIRKRAEVVDQTCGPFMRSLWSERISMVLIAIDTVRKGESQSAGALIQKHWDPLIEHLGPGRVVHAAGRNVNVRQKFEAFMRKHTPQPSVSKRVA